jgi:hypothetical protein
MRKTLITKHETKLKKLNEVNKKSKIVEKKLAGCKKDLSKIEKIPKPERTDVQIDNYFKLKEQIEELETELSKIVKENEKIDYFTKNKGILFDYYNSMENPDDYIADSRANQNLKEHTLQFILQNPTPNPNDSSGTDSDNKNNKNNKNNFSRTELLERYMQNTEKNFIIQEEKTKTIKCPNCNIEMGINNNEGFIFCNKCGNTKLAFIDCDKPSYKDPPHEMSYYPYKRINHFNEILAQLQGKENTNIPPEVFTKLEKEIKKERIKDIDSITEETVRALLKKIGYNKYYEHIYYIIYKLNRKPPSLTPEIEERMRTMFKNIQGPYSECPLTKGRKNFISYYYVYFKFCELLGVDSNRKNKILKSRQRLHQHDLIWKFICDKLGWKFIASV